MWTDATSYEGGSYFHSEKQYMRWIELISSEVKIDVNNVQFSVH